MLASVPSLQLLERKRRREYLEETYPGESTLPGVIPASFTSTRHFTSARAPGLPSSRSARPPLRNLSYLEHDQRRCSDQIFCFHEPSGLDLWCRIVGARRCLAEAFGVLAQKADIG